MSYTFYMDFNWVSGGGRIFDRASPVFCADEDVHTPSADGLRCGFGERFLSMIFAGVKAHKFVFMAQIS